MKYLVISDIHGDFDMLLKSIDAFKYFNCDEIIILGDVLYHGPRNDLPSGYAPKKCISLLNEYKDKITCVKGNCDAEVDQMVLEFDILESHFKTINNIEVYLTHGHHLDMVPDSANIIFYGHTHVSKIERENDKLFINPGSTSIPKGDLIHSFGIIENNTFKILDFNYNVKEESKLC